MGLEIERKFLVASEEWRRGARGVSYRQGYLSTDKGRVVRVRIAGKKGFITIKGPRWAQYEYSIPLKDAQELLDRLCLSPLIEKIRHRISFMGHVWEVDEFSGANRGLILAEIELSAFKEAFSRPPWLGREVTGDPRYSNASLVSRPYGRW